MSAGVVRQPAPPEAEPELMAAARENCAKRREDVEPALAASYRRGEQDEGWAMLHEIARLQAEQERG